MFGMFALLVNLIKTNLPYLMQCFFELYETFALLLAFFSSSRVKLSYREDYSTQNVLHTQEFVEAICREKLP